MRPRLPRWVPYVHAATCLYWLTSSSAVSAQASAGEPVPHAESPASAFATAKGEDEIRAGAATEAAGAPLGLRASGYMDFGFGRTGNRGRGFTFDTTNRFASRFPGVAWVLLGDPWSTAINSRNEPADTTGSFVFTHDPVNSEGALTFLINEVNFDLSASPSPRVFLFASVDLMPRTGSRGSLGDFFEIDYAFADFTPFDSVDLTLSVGKFDSAFGREYRLQESTDRPGIVPSLLFRYVGGHPLGIKARLKLVDERFVLNVAATNGSSFIESTQQADEVDMNDAKTLSGRVSLQQPLPFGAKLDVGLSGESGVQARQVDRSVSHWQWGTDALLEWRLVELRGEFVRGIARGGGLNDADGLDYRAFYGEGFFRLLSWAGLLARYEQRHAVNRKGTEFAYLIDVQRIVGGVRFDLSAWAILKLEYIANLEMRPLRTFSNDVMTSSLVLVF